MSFKTLQVELGERSYPIHVGRDLSEMVRDCVLNCQDEGRRLAVITDTHVSQYQKRFLRKAFGNLPVLILPAGEATKAFRHLETCCTFLADAGLDRGGRIFAVGGGVIGDLAGFTAASYYRGLGFYQVPTSVLAMVDSSVGGKTGINLMCGKNLVGAFHQPLAVFADLDTLQSLPGNEFSAGMAEIIKHGLLADVDLFEKLESLPRLGPQSPELIEIIQRNCAIKAGVVSADEKEQSAKGGRALLNLGHTFGHAIEAVAGYGTYLHGEAVALGLVLAARLSHRLGLLPEPVDDRIVTLLERYQLPVRLRQPLQIEMLLTASRKDKKVRAGKTRYVAMEAIGRAVTVDTVPETLISELWEGAGGVVVR